MFEVEIRGRLAEAEFLKLKSLFAEKGVHVESHTREMIRLYDYPGFSEDPLRREVDIRLRDTNGKCEIMVKRKASENNIARHELSLKLQDANLDNAKAVVKALGYSKGLWMHRKKEVYQYNDIEWSLVEAPKKYFYYEAEREVADESYIFEAEAELRKGAEALGLTVFAPEEYQEFIQELSHEVNTVIQW